MRFLFFLPNAAGPTQSRPARTIWRRNIVFLLCFSRNAKVGNPTNALRISKTARKRGRRLWLALAAMTLAAAIGVSVLALAIQFKR
jgi:hypothetical protein